jgi:hypothetical protein
MSGFLSRLGVLRGLKALGGFRRKRTFNRKARKEGPRKAQRRRYAEAQRKAAKNNY